MRPMTSSLRKRIATAVAVSITMLGTISLQVESRRAAGHTERPFSTQPSTHKNNLLRDYGTIPIWPLPSNASYATNTFLDPTTFSIVIQPSTDSFLQALVSRYTPLIVYLPNAVKPTTSSTPFSTLYVNVIGNDTSVHIPQQDTDESYSLGFSPDGSSAVITANTVFGARHGLESFSQLVDGDRLTGLLSISGLNITETPRFPYRGLLIDAARHWLPPNFLLNMMDSMSYNKLNAIQIGFGIDWSWTAQSSAFPNLTDVSYGPKDTHIYTRETITWLVQEAALRGVRIIPYMEVLSHDALGYAMPELMWCNSVQGKGGLPHPLLNATWDFFDTLWADYASIFPEDYMLVGGDELDASCWMNDTLINNWNAAHNYTGTGNITALYYVNLMNSLKKNGFKPMFFAEAFGILNGSNINLEGTDVIFDAWDMGTPGSAADIIMAPGAKAIISSYCFLAPTNSCPDNLPGGLTPNWDSNLACEPQNQSLFPAEAWPYLGNIVGGHESRWGEQSDATNMFTVTLPALLGVAEKLWSDESLTNGSYYGSRQEVFAFHRCVQIRRGVPVQPTSAYSWSCDFEWEPAYPPLTPLHPNPNSSWVVPSSISASSSPIMNSDIRGEMEALRSRVAELERLLAEKQNRSCSTSLSEESVQE